MAVCPPGRFRSASRPTSTLVFASVVGVAFVHKGGSMFSRLHTCDLCTRGTNTLIRAYPEIEVIYDPVHCGAVVTLSCLVIN